MNRPTVSLCLIAKNEAHNVTPLLSSVKGCFDEIIFVDTGSTDNTQFFIEQVNKQIEAGSSVWAGIPEIKVYHFDWINDFAAARNFCFDKATKDYVCWLDLDDSLSDAKAFIQWRDTVMHAAHYWLAVYNYAFDEKGNVKCQFVRERVIKRNHGFKWEYPVHEGLIQKEGKKFWPNRVNSWWVNHRRGAEDIKQDHMRNVKIMEKLDMNTVHPRMKFYYGKELFENGFQKEAGKPLMEAAAAPELDLHDRLLTMQYAAQSAVSQQAWPQALDILFNGLKIMPNRAEYWCLLGDVYSNIGQVENAMMAYQTAILCKPNNLNGTVVVEPGAYGEYPHIRLAQINLGMGNWLKAADHIDVLHKLKVPNVAQLEAELIRIKDLSEVRSDLPKTDDVIITCPGQMMGDWDEHTLKARGHGGSETAAIEVAKWIRQKTNRRVKIFQNRKQRSVMESGVEYEPVSDLNGYLKNVEPKAHIAWRHPTKMTKALTFAWCHDLQMPGASKGVAEFDKIVALSEFHKNYLIETCGVDEKKIILGFNGVNPEDFAGGTVQKDPLKVVFSSSPDRGLVQAVDIVKKAREISGLDIKLHCFYGTDNMRKMGLTDWADSIEKKLKDNDDFVVYHGMVNKVTLMNHFRGAAVWLYVNDFIETFCITALEAMCAGTWPIVRPIAALPFTMKDAIAKGCVDLIETEVVDEASVGLWANTLVEALLEKKWQRMDFSPENYSWEKVADFFIKEMGL